MVLKNYLKHLHGGLYAPLVYNITCLQILDSKITYKYVDSSRKSLMSYVVVQYYTLSLPWRQQCEEEIQVADEKETQAQWGHASQRVLQ